MNHKPVEDVRLCVVFRPKPSSHSLSSVNQDSPHHICRWNKRRCSRSQANQWQFRSLLRPELLSHCCCDRNEQTNSRKIISVLLYSLSS